MTIGLVGEAPNDVNSVHNILSQKYNLLKYVNLLNNINGSQLESQKTKRFLRIEYEEKKPDLVIFIRDLDSKSDNKVQLDKRKAYFTEFKTVVDKKALYLLNIFEIEALIFFDIDTFNNKYDCIVEFEGCPTDIVEPKEYLKKFAKNYTEIQNSEIFRDLSFEKLNKCYYFNEFINSFEKQLK